MSKTASRSGARVPPPLLDLLRSESQLHAWKRLQEPGGTQVFFPNRGLLRTLRWKRPLVVCCWTLRSHDDLAPPKILEKKEEVPRWNHCRTHWARQVGASSAWFYSLAWIFLSSPERFLRGSDRDPARQTETCEYEPFVTPSVRETKWKFRPNTVSIEFVFFAFFFFFSSFFFFFFHFYIFRNGQGQTPPPPNGHARILVNAEIYGRSLIIFARIKFAKLRKRRKLENSPSDLQLFTASSQKPRLLGQHVFDIVMRVQSWLQKSSIANGQTK